jgi:hypothetical protein
MNGTGITAPGLAILNLEQAPKSGLLPKDCGRV